MWGHPGWQHRLKQHTLQVGFLASCLSARCAFGQEAKPDPDTPGQHQVHFQAGRLELDPSSGRLLLTHGFSLQAERYRLVGDSVSLTNSPQGVLVEGNGRVAFCACESPIITFGFSSATVAPPSDLLMTDTVVRVGPVPVLWLPYFWLRSPARVGLLPPHFEYRAEEGLLATSGVHIPLGSGDAGAKKSLDLRAGGYLRGGTTGQINLRTLNTTTGFEADYQREWVYASDARGVVELPSDTLAWDADWRGGRRARQSSVALAPAAQRYDHARAELSVLGRAGGVAFGPAMTAERGGPPSQVLAGPETHFAIGGNLIPGVLAETSGGVAHFQAASGATQANAYSLSEISIDAHLGMLGAHVVASEAVGYQAEGEAVALSSQPSAALRISAPFVADLNAAPDPVRHFVEPNLVVAGSTFSSRGHLISASQPIQQGPAFVSAVGLRNLFGVWGERRAVEFSWASGWVGQSSEPTLAHFAHLAHLGKLLLDAGWLSGSSAFAVSRDAGVSITELAFGKLGQPRLALTESSAYGTRNLGQGLETWATTEQTSFGWLTGQGDSLGAELSLPVSRALAFSIGGDGDARRAELIAVRSAAAYRHPCGCFALSAWAGERTGRRGIDAWLTVDLIP